MKIYTMNGGFARNVVVDGFSRNTTVNDHNRYGTDDYPNPNDYRDEYFDDDPFTGDEMEWTEDEVMDGLSRMQVMDDEEMSEELGKLRIRFGKGKKRKARKQRKAIRKESRKQKKASLKHGRKKKKTERRARRGKAMSKFSSLIRDVAGAFGRKDGAIPEEVQMRMVAEAAELEPDVSWWQEEGMWGMTNQQLVIGGSAVGLVAIGGIAWAMNRKKKKKR